MPIHTDAEGLDERPIKIPTADGELPGYLAMPTRGGPFPVLLVIQEIFGVNDYIQDVCRRLAKAGYLAIAPELFWRQGDPAQVKDLRAPIEDVVSQVPDSQVMSDLDSAIDFAARGRGDPTRIGVNGFCWGGRAAWLFASHSDRLKAAVAWYGKLAGATDALHPRHPVDIVGSLRCPVLGLYGGMDPSIPVEQVQRMRAAIAAARKNAEIVLYPEAGHAFHADYRPTYNDSAACDGWTRLREWFRQYGVS